MSGDGGSQRDREQKSSGHADVREEEAEALAESMKWVRDMSMSLKFLKPTVKSSC